MYLEHPKSDFCRTALLDDHSLITSGIVCHDANASLIPTLDLGSGGRFKKTYELLNRRALNISTLYENRIFQSMGKIYTKYLIHTLNDVLYVKI